MSTQPQLDVDRLREKFPRTHKALIEVYPFAPWDQMLRVIEGAMHEGKTASVIAGKLSILRGLDRSTRRWIVLSLAADRKEIFRNQKSFLTRLFERSLEDILAELRDVEAARYAGPATPAAPRDDLSRDFSFISHSKSGEGRLALALAEALEQRGCPCWVAPRDVPDGGNWNEEVYGAAQRCGHLILLYSKKAAASKHVQGETHIVVARGIDVFVVQLDEGDPAKMNVGLGVSQHIDWTKRDKWADLSELAQRLAAKIALEEPRAA